MSGDGPAQAAAAPGVSVAPAALPAGERRFLVGLALLYVVASVAVVFAVDRFWSANWDVEIFLGAARSFFDGGSIFDLYARSRADFAWPYPYPPLYALLLAPLVALADLPGVVAVAPWAPLLAVRLPVVVADIAIAWLLHRIVARETETHWLARLAAAGWLFTPILFYQTAIQAHQESIWLWPALAAYDHLQRRGRERFWWPALLLVLAVSLKQSAVLYLVPVGLWLLLGRRWRDLGLFAALFVALFGGLALPFALHSGDFAYMVFRDVPNMPVQTQSWVPWLLLLEPYRIEQTRSTFPLIRYASLITLGAAGLLALVALRRRLSWHAIGLLVTLAFVLLSQKVMAYHYPMLVPWLLASWLPARRVRAVGLLLLWVSWIVVSPYYAPWADPGRLPLYAALGTLNSFVFLALLAATLAGDIAPRTAPRPDEGVAAQRVAGWLALLMLGFLLASLAHPLTTLAPQPGSDRATLALGLLVLVVVLVLALWTPVARWVARALALPSLPAVALPPTPARQSLLLLLPDADAPPPPPTVVPGRLRLTSAIVLLTLWFVPLFFTWFTMTAEVTKVIEQGLAAAWGL